MCLYMTVVGVDLCHEPPFFGVFFVLVLEISRKLSNVMYIFLIKNDPKQRIHS